MPTGNFVKRRISEGPSRVELGSSKEEGYFVVFKVAPADFEYPVPSNPDDVIKSYFECRVSGIHAFITGIKGNGTHLEVEGEAASSLFERITIIMKIADYNPEQPSQSGPLVVSW